MRQKFSLRHVRSNGSEDQIYAITSFSFSESLTDPLSTASITFEPLPKDAARYREMIQRGEVLRFYLDGALQCTLLIESVTSSISSSSGMRIEASCVHPIKILYEGQLSSSYEKLFRTKQYTLGQLIVDVVSRFFFSVVPETAPQIGNTVYVIDDLPIFEPDDAKEGNQRLGLSPQPNDPTSTNWRSVNVQEARAQNNETAYAFLARQATRYGLILRPAASGAVMLTRPKNESPATYTLSTDNSSGVTALFIDQVTETSSNEGQPSAVYVKGQTSTREGNTRVARGSVEAQAADLIPERSRFRAGSWYPYKPVYAADKHAPDQRRCENSAKLILGLRAKDAYKLNVKLDGTGDRKSIYAINTVANVSIRQLGIEGDFLIVKREISIDNSSGQTTSLELVPKGALIIGEEPS